MSLRAYPYPVVSATSCRVGVNVQEAFNDTAFLDQGVAMGATMMRGGMGWNGVENYNTGALSVTNQYQTYLQYCATNGIEPIFVASYGSPYRQIMSLTVTANTASNSLTIPVSGSLGTLDTPYCTVQFDDGAGGAQMASIHSYAGAMIDSVDVNGGTITLASATTMALSSGDQLIVNRYRYPPISSPDPSAANVQAYIRYAKFLAQTIASYGCTGWVCLWNEVPWADDPWNNLNAYYDNPPTTPDSIKGLTPILIAALQVTDLPDGVRFINGASDKSGANALLSNPYLTQYVTPHSIALSIAADGTHPYGQYPEHGAWYPGVIDDQQSNRYLQINSIDNGNAANVPLNNDTFAAANNGAKPAIMATECGINLNDDERHCTYVLRRVISLWGMSVTPVVFCLSENTRSFMLVDFASRQPRPAYTGLQRIMTAVRALGAPRTGATVLPTLAAWTYNDTTRPIMVSIYGDAGKALVFLWLHVDGSDSWPTDPIPAARTLQLALPDSTAITSIIDVGNNTSVAYTHTNGLIQLAIGDRPIMIKIG